MAPPYKPTRNAGRGPQPSKPVPKPVPRPVYGPPVPNALNPNRFANVPPAPLNQAGRDAWYLQHPKPNAGHVKGTAIDEPWSETLTTPKGTVLTGPNKGNTRQDILAMQRTLINHGYAIAADGILGAQTKSALADWHKGVGKRDPHDWTTRGVFSEHPTVQDTHHTNSPTTKNNQNAQPGHVKVTTDQGTQSSSALASALAGLSGLGDANDDVNLPNAPGAKPLGGRGIDPGNFYTRLEGMLPNNQVDPKTYTNALMEAKYGPILAELHRQSAAQGRQNVQSEHDVQNWYNQLTGNMASRAKQDATGDAQMQAGVDSLAGIAGALGIDPGAAGAATLGGTADIASDTARMIAASQQAGDRSMQSVTGLAGVADLQNLKSKDAAALAEINANITDTLGQRGNDYETSLADVRQQNSQNRLAYTNAMAGLRGQESTERMNIAKYNADTKQNRFTDLMAKAQFSSGLRHTQLADKLAEINTGIAASMAPLQYQTGLANLAGIKAGTHLTNVKTNDLLHPPGKGGPAPWKTLDQGQLSGLNQQLSDIVSSPSSGVFTLDPRTGTAKITNSRRAVEIIGSKLRSAGYDPATNPRVKQFAFNILRGIGITPDQSWYPVKGGKTKGGKGLKL